MIDISIIEKNKKSACALVELCIEKGIKLTSAESCTGGLISAYITSVPGSSAVFDGSLVSYANRIKAGMLKVPRKVIEERGVVSSECVHYMALGAAELFGADLSIAVSGIAGPGGAVPGKPVGTVYIAVRYGDNEDNGRYSFDSDRDGVRELTADAALCAALRLIAGGNT